MRIPAKMEIAMRLIRLLAALAALTAAPSGAADLFRDDFSHFPPGWLSYPVGTLNAAIQEYHYLPNRGVPLGPWENAICHMDAWLVGDEDGHPFVEQRLVKDGVNQYTNPIFLTGDSEWSDYTVEVKMRPLDVRDMAGVVFRYHTNRHYYLFALTGGNEARLVLHLPLDKTFRVPDWKELGAVPFAYDVKHYYSLRVENNGPRIRAFVDGKLVLEASDSGILKGKAGLTAESPARYEDFTVTAPDAEAEAIQARIRTREAELTQLRAGNPLPKLWKKFNTPGFGAGRNVRFGDLDGDGVADMLIAQNVSHAHGDAFDAITCLTAVNFDGKVLWQSGRPDPRNTLLTNDTPFQIHDIDGDGRNEVVVVRDFKLEVLAQPSRF
jgi:rhamnogalacturonan endolyase